MKKLYIAGLVFAIFAFSPGAFAQQSINNDGVTGSDLQPQGQVRQNSTGSQQTQDVANDVANSKVLENTQVQSLQVSGAPADSQVEETQTTYRWVVMFVLFLLLLMGPALLYARDLRNKRQSTPKDSVSGISAEEEAEVSEPVAIADDNKSANTAQEDKPVAETEQSKPKKKKKKQTNKQKRGKKKRK